MRFAKYQGTGNDFVMLADLQGRLTLTPQRVRTLCDRRFGIGADGVIRVSGARGEADLVMDYFNSDGSTGEMCGNGIRCVAVFAQNEGMVDRSRVRVATGAGVKTVTVMDEGRVRVDMGRPLFAAEEIPIEWDGTDPLHAKLEVGGAVLEAACLSMGNPHAVLFVDDPESAPVGAVGPMLEVHRAFPNGVNVSFVRVETHDRIEMRVWERGSRETLACGTAACAAMVAARVLRGVGERSTVVLRGGVLDVEWGGSIGNQSSVFMTGTATEVFRGEADL
jgi:diaminopimelate epimerase